MPALDLGPGKGLPAQAASCLDRARVREFFEARLDCSLQQSRFRLVEAARLASQRGVNFGREFQIQFSGSQLAVVLVRGTIGSPNNPTANR